MALPRSGTCLQKGPLLAWDPTPATNRAIADFETLAAAVPYVALDLGIGSVADAGYLKLNIIVVHLASRAGNRILSPFRQKKLAASAQ
jgi:hypothetical protein